MFEKAVILGIFAFSTLFFSFLIRVLKISTNRKDKWLAGVCAGLSKCSDMPVWMIRAFFLLFILFLGYGVILYWALWLFMIKEDKIPKNTSAAKEGQCSQT